MPDYFIVGGDFDPAGGRPSKIVASLAGNLGPRWACVNGGTLQDLVDFDPSWAKVLIWMPNVSNDIPKTIDRLKAINPEMLLIQSKRVIEKDYSTSDVVGRLLKSHSGLGIVIRKDENGELYFEVVDPLGNLWGATRRVQRLAQILSQRIAQLTSFTRYRSRCIQPIAQYPSIPDDFIHMVQRYGAVFAKHVNAVNPTRLLGNASTRCSKGFPVIRGPGMGSILVSRRNVGKENITPGDFVEASLGADNIIEYKGRNKPSVDTPAQLALMMAYPNAKYMIHGHVYVKGAPFTREKVPCGALEEFDEVTSLFRDSSLGDFAVNLWGHGCLIVASDLLYFEKMLPRLISRPIPEGPSWQS